MTECLYNGKIPIFMKNGQAGFNGGSAMGFGGGNVATLSANSDFGRKLEGIILDISLSTQFGGRRNLELELSDSADPFFLWTCSLSEEEYSLLRREQNLLVEYARFPFKLIELLQNCSAHAHELNPTFFAQFQAVVEGNTGAAGGSPSLGNLTIFEATTFKQIPHLTLRFHSASEQVLRRHLSEEEIKVLRTGNVPTAAANNPYRVDLARQPLAPLGDIPSERMRYLEGQNQILNGQKVALETELLEMRRKIQQMQEELRRAGLPIPFAPINSTYDLEKANEIIKKLQDEVKSLKARARSAESSLRQLQKVTKDGEVSAEQMRADLASIRGQFEEKTKALTAITSERDHLKGEVDEMRKLVEANEKVIGWLHNQINEDSLTKLLGRPTGNTLPGINYRYNYPEKGAAGPLAGDLLGGPILPPQRISPDIWLGKGKVAPLNVPSSSSTSPPDILNS